MQNKITCETRFAVVMYGGVSLAVYMNGIAQELLSMVRSTSLSIGDPDDLTGTASVYRKIADYLSIKDNGTVDHRFVVDIISGTSAGGINGICLAKGLVKGLENLKALEKTWLEEGDIDKLLNDRDSEPDIYTPKEPRTSLFNSQRMYAKLLDAFKEMESASDGKGAHIHAMDLFVTATDLRGLQLPVLLSDGKAFERLYKHVFPFVFRSGELYPNRTQNHFTGEYDPMLAFASRCTSSFPTAFEPVTIADVMQYLEMHDPKSHKLFKDNIEKWENLFFGSYHNSDGGVPLLRREFADGGYLDNRPFGHAIHAIHEREAYCPVRRKLLFIDPVPEVPDTIGPPSEISFVKNSVLASFSLPGYETIREEIDALRKRNEWIQTVNDILEKLDEQNITRLKSIIQTHFLDFYDKPGTAMKEVDRTTATPHLFALPASGPATLEITSDIKPQDKEVLRFWEGISVKKSIEKSAPQKGPEEAFLKYDSKDLGDMVELLGSGYTSYHFTRLSMQTEQLSLMIIRAMRAERRPDIIKAVNQIVTAWRKHHFASNHSECKATGKKTENIFFRNFDIDFRIRRLNFFRKTIEEAVRSKSTKSLYFDLIEDNAHPDFILDDQFKGVLMAFYKEIVDSIRNLYRLRALLLSDSSLNPLAAGAGELRTGIEAMLEEKQNNCTLSLNSGLFDELASCFDRANEANGTTEPFTARIDNLMTLLHDVIRNGPSESGRASGSTETPCDGTIALSTKIYQAFEALGKENPGISGRMCYVYDYGYDLYDSTKLTLLAGGEYGEGRQVDIYRISPADTVSLWDESVKKRSKLAGIALSSFGGFLDREWRRNDILWGRLDAAERIITAILPDEEDEAMKAESIMNAQHAIIDETTRDWMNELERSRFSVTKDNEQYNRLQSIRKLLDSHANVLPDGRVLPQPEWKKQFSSAYDFHREIEPEPNLRRLGRSSAILSSMIDRLDGGEGIGGKISGYLKKLNWVLLGMLDFSTPKSLKGVLFQYWLQLIILVSITLIASAYILGSVSSLHDASVTVNRCGWALLIIDLIVWGIRQSFETGIHKISLRPWLITTLRTIAALISIAVFITLVLTAETLFVHGQELLNALKSVWLIFLNGMIDILKQQIGWRA